MKKLLSLTMVAVLLLNTSFISNNAYAAGSNSAKIQKAFDGFRYKMTVALNPEDSQFKEKTVAEFKQNMINLQAEGITSSEIMSEMRSSILDSETRKDFDSMFSSLNVEKLTSEDAGNMAMQFMAAKYQQGASYSGGGKGSLKVALAVIGAVIVGVVTYLVIKDMKCKDNTVTVTNNTTSTVTNNTTSTVTDTVTETYTNTNTNTGGGCCPCGPPPELYQSSTVNPQITDSVPGPCCPCSQDNVL